MLMQRTNCIDPLVCQHVQTSVIVKQSVRPSLTALLCTDKGEHLTMANGCEGPASLVKGQPLSSVWHVTLTVKCNVN